MQCDEGLTGWQLVPISMVHSSRRGPDMSKKPAPSRPTKAAEFLKIWAENDASKLSIRQSAKKLEELIALADQDFAQCRDDADRQAIWFVLVGGIQAFNVRIGYSAAVEGLHTALANRSYGLRGYSPLDRRDRARKQWSVAEFLEKWERKNPSSLSISKNAIGLQELIKRADRDYAQCRRNTHRQVIWSVLAGGLEAFYAPNGHCRALSSLRTALEDRSCGLKGLDALDRCSPAVQQRSVREEFDRALVMIALKNNPNEKRKILTNAYCQFGWPSKEMRKFIDNYNRVRNFSQGLHRDLDDLRARYDDSDLAVFDDLLK